MIFESTLTKKVAVAKTEMDIMDTLIISTWKAVQKRS